VIESFGNAGTEDVWVGDDTKAARKVCPVELWARARQLLDQLHAATAPGDLRLPPSNRLHPLKGDLAGFYSVSINMKYRVIFRFQARKATDVEIIDYH
jgi:proteic killer suppression protein